MALVSKRFLPAFYASMKPAGENNTKRKGFISVVGNQKSPAFSEGESLKTVDLSRRAQRT
jgi:hypothetical protein